MTAYTTGIDTTNNTMESPPKFCCEREGGRLEFSRKVFVFADFLSRGSWVIVPVLRPT